jgi:hypothetical protein
VCRRIAIGSYRQCQVSGPTGEAATCCTLRSDHTVTHGQSLRNKMTHPKNKTDRATLTLGVILGFRRVADENCALPGCYASGGNSLPMFRDKISIPSSGARNKNLTTEHVIDII